MYMEPNPLNIKDLKIKMSKNDTLRPKLDINFKKEIAVKATHKSRNEKP